MKLFTRILTILLLPLILIGGVNYFFDPDYTLRKDYIAPLAKALANSKMISGPVNINSRILKKHWIKQLKAHPEILVLGSSRTLALSQQIFPEKSFVNASVTNCTFQDMYVFLHLIEEKQSDLPPTVIICADQWLFGNSFVEKQWLVNRSEFTKMAKKIGGVPLNEFPPKWDLDKEWIKELFSVRYLIRSGRRFWKTEKFEICESVNNEKMMLLPDGSRFIPERVVNAPEIEVSQMASNYFYSCKDEHFAELDPLQCKLFAGMVDYLKKQNCKIILFVPPYHPETYQLLKQSPQTIGIFKAESYLRDFALEHDLQILGGTNPDDSELSANDFYDAVHLKPKSLSNFFKNKGIN